MDDPEQALARQVRLAEEQDRLMAEVMPRVAADVAAYRAADARRTTVRLRRAYRALRGRP